MNVYKYDEITKEYTGVETAHLNPLETEIQGKDVYLLPANATFDMPYPVKTGYAQVYKDNVWNYVEDNRGKEYWLDADEYGTPARVMKELGEFPANAVFEAPQKPFNQLKAEKLQEVDTWTARKITGGFVSTCYNGESILYDTDIDTQITMQFAKNCCDSDRFAEELPNGLEVRGYEQVDVDEDGTLVFSKDKTIYYFSPEQIKTWNEDFALFLRECKKEGWMKQAEVNACTTKEELAKGVLDY